MDARYVIVFRSDTDQTPIAEWLNALALDDYTLVATQRGSSKKKLVRADEGMFEVVDTGTDFIFERKS